MILTLRTRVVALAAAALLAAAAIAATSGDHGQTSADSTWLSPGPHVTVADGDITATDTTDAGTPTPAPTSPVSYSVMDTTWA